MNKQIGFIGCGNMGMAIIGGMINNNIVSSNKIMCSDLNTMNLKNASEKYGITTTTDNNEVAKNADILILSIKPDLYSSVINEIKEVIKNDVIVVTIAAGKSINSTEDTFDKKLKVVRVMPNTPALVGEGMSALCPNEMVTEKDLEDVLNIFNSFGQTEIVSEKLMDVVTSVSGSSPAYVYMIIEAMADAAVLDGMPRNQAYKFAAQAVLGSAKMVLETGIHPGALKDMVCSPGGTTIEAVATLEEKGLRTAIISAMQRCTQKSIELSNQTKK
ncbi:pyrroline-5-carboxylate reductase [Bacillus toyonensis]|uniref:pyrroline-5-carboxylate reductase n=1 Tax=Bacillus toyonensis TaxID=155322 RepID=UPI000B450E1D|nr:pyrroline-5-carboxylate reductase [Bacillus toyonensis]OTX39466.1 pyrroline-5-carboxylate reductase [Bacillus thuringiensis serovar malayensis]OUB08169.1 pyrroline-5-carboxylate reductase [Bacillus thuringiensis serovar shandongiensis]MBX0355661.1 pyrroline-5-carboxylate reductase [Bacillus toyonensis]MDM5254163.1 pyrroline-5-carboxylate reductase [Bacillus toyonensis]MEC2392291.1 pyrroline-5-carboxylate reductase [Bacillus toyonensis]